jgi:succinyl-CoA synthetase alpha subunit
MSILIDKDTRLLIQGITGKVGIQHTKGMIAAGTSVVAGVSPTKGGEWVLEGKIPVFASVHLAVEVTGANASIVFVPARYALDALYEAADAGLPLVVCLTEGIPILDMMRIKRYYDEKGIVLIGPNSLGLITPGESSVGIIPGNIVGKGNIGVISRSSTLTLEVLNSLKMAGLGVSTCVGIGGDPIVGSDFVRILSNFEDDPYTDQILLIGEIGGSAEERAAQYILNNVTKPVVAYVAGSSAPVGRRMGHAGAIIEMNSGNAIEKIKAFQAVGIRVANVIDDIVGLLK